jgi:hypothetical protein
MFGEWLALIFVNFQSCVSSTFKANAHDVYLSCCVAKAQELLLSSMMRAAAIASASGGVGTSQRLVYHSCCMTALRMPLCRSIVCRCQAELRAPLQDPH